MFAHKARVIVWAITTLASIAVLMTMLVSMTFGLIQPLPWGFIIFWTVFTFLLAVLSPRDLPPKESDE
jgi:hypothetical protein